MNDPFAERIAAVRLRFVASSMPASGDRSPPCRSPAAKMDLTACACPSRGTRLMRHRSDPGLCRNPQGGSFDRAIALAAVKANGRSPTMRFRACARELRCCDPPRAPKCVRPARNSAKKRDGAQAVIVDLRNIYLSDETKRAKFRHVRSCGWGWSSLSSWRAERSNPAFPGLRLDCFVASLLAMTRDAGCAKLC